MLLPLLLASRRHLVVSIQPGSLPLSASCAVIGQPTHTLSPPLRTAARHRSRKRRRRRRPGEEGGSDAHRHRMGGPRHEPSEGVEPSPSGLETKTTGVWVASLLFCPPENSPYGTCPSHVCDAILRHLTPHAPHAQKSRKKQSLYMEAIY